MNILKRIETSGKLFLLLMLDKSYTSNLSIEPEKVEQSFSKICFLDNINRPREVKNRSHNRCLVALLADFFFKKLYSSMRDASIKLDF